MEDHLRAAGRSITLRRTAQRWLEYAFAAWIVALGVLVIDRISNIPLVAVVVGLILVGGVFAVVAVLNNLRFVESSRQERALTREHHRRNSSQPPHSV